MTHTATYSFGRNLAGKERARLVAETLQGLEQAYGTLTPGIVVEAARDPDSVLHPFFQWDNERAAEAFRLSQARMLIRELRVVYVGNDGTKTQPARVYLNLDRADDEANAYVPVARILSDRDLYERARAQFIRETHAFEARFREFESLAALVRGVREMAEKLTA